MNKMYRQVWNKALGVVQVASEQTCSSHGGSLGASGSAYRLKMATLTAAIGLILASAPVVSLAQSCSKTSGTIDASCTGTTSSNGATGLDNDGGSPSAQGSGSGGTTRAGGLGGAGSGDGGVGGIYPSSNSFFGGSGGGGGVYGGGGSTGSGTVGRVAGTGAGGGGGNPGVLSTGDLSVGAGVTVTGGTGGAGGFGYAYGGGGGGGAAGAALGVAGSTFSNRGTVAGGAGGAGGDAYLSGGGGGGGAGLYVGTGDHDASNAGHIMGGAGGHAGGYDDVKFSSLKGSTGAGGNGGAGLVIGASNNTFTNTGSITGGDGGAGTLVSGNGSSSMGGTGGAGVVSTGGATLINSGAIAGGKSGMNGDGTGGDVQADAVDFSGGGNTLELRDGYSFVGNVISTSGTTNGGDALVLGGDAGGSFDLTQIVMAMPTSYSGSPQYAGFANYTKTGSGMWTLTGSSNATTDWTVSAGKLEVGDAAHPDTVLTGDVTVTGGTLGGHGTITGAVSNLGGTVMPGGSVGILTLSGDYVQGPNGTLSLEVTPDPAPGTGSSQLRVSGKASLDGTLAIVVDPGAYLADTSYDLVHASGGVRGTFAKTTFDPAFAAYLTPLVSYSGNDVTLTLAPNAAAFADGYPNYASTVSLGMEQTFDAVLGRMGPTAQGRQGVWGQTMAGLGGLGQGSRYQLNGAAAGYGHVITDRFVLGVAVSGGTTTTTVDAMQVRAKPFGGFVYGIWRNGGWKVSGSFGVGKLKQDSKRYLSVVSGIQTAHGEGRYNGAALRVDYTARAGRWSFTPYAGMDTVNARYDAAQEQGITLLALHYGKVSQHLSHYQAGLRIGAEWGHWQPWVQAGTEGWGGDRAIMVTESLGDYPKDVTSSALPGSALSGGAGVTWTSARWQASLSWHGAAGHHYHGSRGMLQARYSW
ncbi:hypothetical protein GCM10027285_05630 [Oleiagrimonas citrea]|uniref:Autotransporter domain-containing protein n=1 Tax=Oleiagrimonas citrea TaxID=1665687 RepID=A0A846ZQ86_9GAMM|nr:autotransporter domain-containing protein [Oleiagrimonas citrea]NKZ39601.1 autotransporter domain-containing protein [Oleiagrimonas citrea]